MRNRKYIVFGVALWIILVIIIVIINRHHQPVKVNLYKATPGGTNIQFPYLAAPHTINFFTGSSFASYDARNQTTKTISPQFILPTVSQVRWSKNGILFMAGGYTPADDLFEALNDKGLPTNKEYWWLYSFSDKKLNVVVPKNAYFNALDAFWDDSETDYCYISTDGSLYLSGDPERAIAKVDVDARIKQFSGSTVTLLDGGNLERVDIYDGKKETIASAHFQDSYVSADGRTIAYILNTHPKSTGVLPGDVYKLDYSNLKPSMVLSDVNGTLAGSDGNLYVGYSDADGNNHLRFFPKKGRSTEYSLGGSLNRGDTIGTVLPVNPGTIYIVSKTNNLIQVSNQEKTVSTPISHEYKIQADLYKKGYEIHYDPYKGTYEIDIAANPFIKYQGAALDYIRKQGVDPNQINITWRAYDGVDKTNPAVDTSPLDVGDFKD